MGKYRGRTNEDRAAKNQRQVVERCELPPDGRDFLEQAAVLLTAGTPIDSKHKDRGPAAKIHALLSGSSTSAQSAALKALGAGHSLRSRSLQPSYSHSARAESAAPTVQGKRSAVRVKLRRPRCSSRSQGWQPFFSMTRAGTLRPALGAQCRP